MLELTSTSRLPKLAFVICSLFLLPLNAACSSFHCDSDDDCVDTTCVGLPGKRICAYSCELGCKEGQRCVEGSDGRSYCVPECSDDTCGDEVCGENRVGLPTCREPCESSWHLEAGVACVEGVPLSCETSGERVECTRCGCASGKVCHAIHGACTNPSSVGEFCRENADCLSGNCGHIGGFVPICNPAQGARCNGDNCVACVESSSGNFCLQICEWDGDCPSGQYCYGSNANGFFCRDRCSASASCPDHSTCVSVGGGLAACSPKSLVAGSAQTRCEDEPEPCSVCDTEATEECRDCAGVMGGAAYEDMCGVCDANPQNDCVQDCLGEWGGPHREDRCGTCDADPTNDCVPATCQSPVAELGGCWFLGQLGQSCDEVCASRGGYDPNTHRVAATSTSRCQTLLQALGVDYDVFNPLGTRLGQGCEARYFSSGTIYGVTNLGEENPARKAPDGRRVCACLQ